MINYTYVLIDPRTGLPFYVGKGSGKRIYQSERRDPLRVKRVKEIKAAGLKVLYEKWFEHEDEDFCYWMEHYLIDYFGLENLLNGTRGGDGPPKGRKLSAEHKAKIGVAHKGRIITWDTIGMRGKTHSIEARAKQRQAKLGIVPHNKGKKKLITINGITKNVCQWALEAGVTRSAFEYRLKKGLKVNKYRKRNRKIINSLTATR